MVGAQLNKGEVGDLLLVVVYLMATINLQYYGEDIVVDYYVLYYTAIRSRKHSSCIGFGLGWDYNIFTCISRLVPHFRNAAYVPAGGEWG